MFLLGTSGVLPAWDPFMSHFWLDHAGDIKEIKP